MSNESEAFACQPVSVETNSFNPDADLRGRQSNFNALSNKDYTRVTKKNIKVNSEPSPTKKQDFCTGLIDNRINKA
jgi:hypothetical protein